MPRSVESGDDDSSVPYPIMLDDGSDTSKDDIGAIDDSCSDGSMLKSTDALSLGICIWSSLRALLLYARERPKILEIALNVQEQILRRTNGMINLLWNTECCERVESGSVVKKLKKVKNDAIFKITSRFAC